MTLDFPPQGLLALWAISHHHISEKGCLRSGPWWLPLQLVSCSFALTGFVVGWLTARHGGRGKEKGRADSAVLAGRTGGPAGLLPTPAQRAAHSLRFCWNTSSLHQLEFAFFWLPECREVVVGMFVASLFKCLFPSDGNQNPNQNKQVTEYPIQPLGLCRTSQASWGDCGLKIGSYFGFQGSINLSLYPVPLLSVCVCLCVYSFLSWHGLVRWKA